MKISFDFDGTLTLPTIQKLAQRHIHYGDEIHITTARLHETKTTEFNNKKLYALADKIGIPKERIHFTGFELKAEFLKTFDIHYDDDVLEIDTINSSDLTCIGILIGFRYYVK